MSTVIKKRPIMLTIFILLSDLILHLSSWKNNVSVVKKLFILQN